LIYKKNDQSGLVEFLTVLNGLEEFGKVEFGPDDIVRSGLVKSYIKRKWELGK
jgi:phosphate starvation-inducible PhoH-like protein